MGRAARGVARREPHLLLPPFFRLVLLMHVISLPSLFLIIYYFSSTLTSTPQCYTTNYSTSYTPKLLRNTAEAKMRTPVHRDSLPFPPLALFVYFSFYYYSTHLIPKKTDFFLSKTTALDPETQPHKTTKQTTGHFSNHTLLLIITHSVH
jgi:prepilin signal peptidase PulO-like enzyme (type II secretory pathway)